MNCINFIRKKFAFSASLRSDGKESGPTSAHSKADISISGELDHAGHEIVPGVRIWYVPHGSNEITSEQSALLTKADLEEFALMRNSAVRRRSLATRAVLRVALSEMSNGCTAPAEWEFERTELGRPQLSANKNNLKFSCSHTPLMSIVVVSTIGDVGIDIADAAVASGTDWLEDVTSVRERRALARLTETAREAAVARLWTLKEAYVKMLGIGIADVSEIAFDLSNDRLLSGGSNDGLTQPVFQTWVVNNRGHRHSVALAMSEPGASSAPVMRCLSEASRVHPRSKLELFAERTAERAASLASVFRTTGAEAA